MPRFGARIVTAHLLLVAGVLRHIELSAPQRLALGTDAIYLLFLIAPRFGNSFIARIERAGERLARQKHAAILAVAIAAILMRAALLPAAPVPVPEIHDEFSYLLAADTFAHGRLANPPNPMSVYLDTFHINEHPMYMSIYPPAQGAVLAVGQLLGHPWIGVILSVAAMCAAIVWALQGWLPPGWALLGGVLVLLQIGISSYWINSYWGGAVAAIGGALVIGALPRVIHRRRPLDAVILGIGVAILANSRPYEGAIFCLPVFAVLLIWLWKRRPEWRSIVFRAGVPMTAVLLTCGAFMLYYNAQLTGHPFLFPEAMYVRSHYATPASIFEKPRPPLHFENPQFNDFYNVWTPQSSWRGANGFTIRNLPAAAAYIVEGLVDFFAWPGLWPLLLASLLVLRDRRVRIFVIQAALGFAGFLTVAWFIPHYAAPLTVTFALILIQVIRHVRKWRFDGRTVGVGMTRAAVISTVLLAPFYHSYVNLHPSMHNRARIAEQLKSTPGKDLVIVRYSPDHNTQTEWVQNGAEIDHSKIVWAREIPGVSMTPLLDYFHDRHIWLVEPDQADPTLQPYSGSK